MKPLPILLIALCVLLSNCTPIYLINKQTFNSIPKGSTKVIVSVDYSADSLYDSFVKILAKDGWQLHADRLIKQINGAEKSIGSGTLLKPTIFIESFPTGSKAYLSGEWGLDAYGKIIVESFANSSGNGMSNIVFEGKGTTKPDLAFQKLVLFASEINSAVISYSK